MIEIIKQIPNYQSLSVQQIAEYLSGVVTIPNMRGWTPVSIEKEGGLPGHEVDIFLDTLKAARGRAASAWTWLSTNKEGLELGSEERQKMIETFSEVGQWESLSSGMTQRVIALGKTTLTRWQQLGGSGDVPLPDTIEKALLISQCRDSMAAILQPLQAKSTALNAWLDSLDTSKKTVEEVQEYCNQLLASSDGNP